MSLSSKEREGCYWLSTLAGVSMQGSSRAFAVEATKVVTAATDGGEILCGYPKQAAQTSTTQPCARSKKNHWMTTRTTHRSVAHVVKLQSLDGNIEGTTA